MAICTSRKQWSYLNWQKTNERQEYFLLLALLWGITEKRTRERTSFEMKLSVYERKKAYESLQICVKGVDYVLKENQRTAPTYKAQPHPAHSGDSILPFPAGRCWQGQKFGEGWAASSSAYDFPRQTRVEGPDCTLKKFSSSTLVKGPQSKMRNKQNGKLQ